MNRIEIIGNLVKDPEIAVSKNGGSYCKMRVAVNDGYKEKPLYFDAFAWDQLAEACSHKFKKWALVRVIGKAYTRPYIGNDGNAYGNITIQAQEADLVTKKKMDENGDISDIDPADFPF